MVGGSQEDSGSDTSGGSGQLDAPYSESYWLKLWAFGTSRDGLGLSELAFWLLTYPEFLALKREWERARGIKPPLTKEQRENLAWGKHKIMELWGAAYDKLTPEQRDNLKRMRGPVQVQMPSWVN